MKKPRFDEAFSSWPRLIAQFGWVLAEDEDEGGVTKEVYAGVQDVTLEGLHVMKELGREVTTFLDGCYSFLLEGLLIKTITGTWSARDFQLLVLLWRRSHCGNYRHGHWLHPSGLARFHVGETSRNPWQRHRRWWQWHCRWTIKTCLMQSLSFWSNHMFASPSGWYSHQYCFLPSRSDIPLVGFSSTMKHRLLHPTLLVDISSLVLWDSRFVLGHSYTPPKSNIEPQTTAIFETIFPVQSCIASGLIPSKNRVHFISPGTNDAMDKKNTEQKHAALAGLEDNYCKVRECTYPAY